MTAFMEFGFWGWLVIGLALLALELLAPATFFLWLGVSALVTSVVLLLAPDTGWQAQLLLFSVLSVASVLVSRRYLVKRQTESDLPNLNRRAEQYVGRVFTLSESIRQGTGKIRVDDTHWKVSGPPLDEGVDVRVTGSDGAVLTVEPASTQPTIPEAD